MNQMGIPRSAKIYYKWDPRLFRLASKGLRTISFTRRIHCEDATLPAMLFTSLVLASLAGLGSAKPFPFRHATILERQEDVRESYDYVIVGAGTAGLTVADRLTESGESAFPYKNYGSHHDVNSMPCLTGAVSDEVIRRGGGRNFNDPGIRYNITSVPQDHMNDRTQDVWIGCCVGGSSAINGMVMVRGTSDEYDGWAELGGPDSTWNWDGILPYFKKAIHFTPPKEDLAEAFNITWDPEAWGMDEDTRIYGSFPEYANPQMTMAKMPGVDIPLDGANGKSGLFWFPTSMDPETFWRSYARTGHYDDVDDELVIGRDNYHVITRNKVNKVLFDGTAAAGVEFSSRDGDRSSRQVTAKKEVVLSAGTVHTPQILQLSGVGPKHLLDDAGIETLVDLPGVGQNFQDHAYLSVGYRWTNGTPPSPDVSSVQGDPRTVAAPNLGAWIGLPVISDRYESLAAAYEAQNPAAHLPPDTHPTVIAGYADFQSLHARLLRSKNVDQLWLPIFGNPGGVVMSMHVLSHGTINIDPLSPGDSEPIVDYRALSNPLDLELMVENIRFMRKYMASEDFAPYGPVETDPGVEVEGDDLREWIRRRIIPTNFHPIATAAKKPQEKGGVVGEDLLVHGTKGLSVVDASIMPMLPGANTQSTVYMLAEKAVNLIKARDSGK